MKRSAAVYDTVGAGDGDSSAENARPTGTGESPSGWAADLGWRLALVVLAAVLVAVGAPTAVVTVCTFLAAVTAVERFVRHRHRGMLDAALVGIGSLVVFLGLTGLLLNYLPGGITRIGWSIALVLLAIGSLTVAGLARDVPPPSPFRPLLSSSAIPTALWAVGACTILAVAVLISARSFNSTHVAPVELSSTAVENGLATVTISAGSAQGPLELDAVTTTGRTVIVTGIEVQADQPGSVVVPVPAETRVLIQLVKPGTTTALRELIFDHTAVAKGATG